MWFRTTAFYPVTGSLSLGELNANTKMLPSADFRHAVWTLATDDNFTGTITFYSSNSEDRPDLDVSASVTNEYGVVQVISLADGSPIDGWTWLVYAGTENAVAQFEINENANKWLWAKVTAYTSGTANMKIDLYDNQ